MLCPHCGQEHPDRARVCANTGLPLGQQVVCAKCGSGARPGSRYCAKCGAPLPRPQSPAPVGSTPQDSGGQITQAPTSSTPSQAPPLPPAASQRDAQPTLPAGSQRRTRPSVSLVEISRRETRPAWIAIPTSPRAAQQWARQNRLWHVLGYVLLSLVLLAGAAGLFQLWSQLRPQQGGIPFDTPTRTLAAGLPSETSIPAAIVAPVTLDPTRATSSPTPVQPPASATTEPTLAAPTRKAAPVLKVTPKAIAPAVPTPAAPPHRLAFYSTLDEKPGIYVMEVDRPTDRRLLPLPDGYDIAVWPAFCGERVAFEVQDRALTLPRWIYLYDLTDQSLRPVDLEDLKPLRLSAPGCSPDGRYLAFSAYLESDWELILLDLARGEIVYRFKSAEYPLVGHASWPLDRETVWWMGTRVNGFYDINRTQDYMEGGPGITQPFAKGKYPAVSPDGSRLAFFCGNLLHLCVAGAPSGEILFQIPVSYFKLVNDLPVPATASWSSDGEWLYFTSSITGNWDIYRVRADGSQTQNLTEDWRSDEFMPAAR